MRNDHIPNIMENLEKRLTDTIINIKTTSREIKGGMINGRRKKDGR